LRLGYQLVDGFTAKGLAWQGAAPLLEKCDKGSLLREASRECPANSRESAGHQLTACSGRAPVSSLFSCWSRVGSSGRPWERPFCAPCALSFSAPLCVQSILYLPLFSLSRVERRYGH